jgi:hypothetical protein
VEAPAELRWVWRGYDAAKTDEKFEMESDEAAKPLWRIRGFSR